jgi:hypothetical protein
MEKIALLVAILVPTFVAILLPLIPILWEGPWRAAQDQARARRLHDAKMKARLLRLNI